MEAYRRNVTMLVLHICVHYSRQKRMFSPKESHERSVHETDSAEARYVTFVYRKALLPLPVCLIVFFFFGKGYIINQVP